MHTEFRKYWSSSACSNLADGVYLVALPLLALQITGSPGLVAGVTVAVRAPWLLFALLAGVAADRFQRRRLLQYSAVVRALALGGLTAALLADQAPIWLVYAVALVLGSAETLGDTTAHSALPALVPPASLDRANGWLQTAQLVGGEFVAPPVAGALAAIAMALAVGTGAALYAAAAVAISLVAADLGPPAAEEARERALAREVREGLAYLWRNPYLRPMAGAVTGINLALGAFFALLPVFAVAPGPLGLTERGYGLLVSGLGAGALLALVAIVRVPAERVTGPVVVGAVAVMAVAVGAPFAVADVRVLFVALVALGAVVLLFNVRTLSIRQRIVPAALLGRVNASYRLCAYGALPVGAGLGGAVAESAGVRLVFLLAAVPVTVTLPLVRWAFVAVRDASTEGRG